MDTHPPLASPHGSHRERENSVFLNFIIDLVLMLPDLAAAIISGSLTLWSDVIKCMNELTATFLSWIVIRKIGRGRHPHYDYGPGKLESLACMVVALIMVLSVGLVIFNAVMRILKPAPLEPLGVWMGVVFMAAGMGVNGWLWLKNYRLARTEYSPVMESQWRLFRVKTLSDASAFVALLVTLLFEGQPWVDHVDAAASLVIAVFLSYTVIGVLSQAVDDLLDKTIEESMQIVILKELVDFFEEYCSFERIRSRRAGPSVYIEIHLGFDGTKTLSEVQAVIDRIRANLEGKIRGSHVTVIPSAR
ncbi:MAG: cation diffusion facilitator family transporter [Acidobacteria bacterium]|nr:cation diffusion facilitator family transporter [Acidobacteriota bacterium]